jgi:hypothetical protein
MCFKVWEELTIPTYAKHARYGSRAGQVNPNFLNADAFIKLVLQPYRDARFGPTPAPFCLSSSATGCRRRTSSESSTTSFHGYRRSFATPWRSATRACSGPATTTCCRAHGVAHVYNHWSSMPPLAEQHQRMGTFTAPFTVLRLLTPLKMTYEAAKKRAEPYDKIVGELPEMREDTVSLIQEATGENRTTYVLVNNRAEGNAPLTIQALVRSPTSRRLKRHLDPQLLCSFIGGSASRREWGKRL